jgi:hypothetical protein
MNLTSAVSALSRLPLPTVHQSAIAGTVASLCAAVFCKIQENLESNSPISKTFGHIASLMMSVTDITGIVTVLAVTQKKWPLLSRAGLGLTCLPIALLLRSYITEDDSRDGMECLFIISLAINFFITGTSLYQERSLLNSAHFAASWLPMPIIIC